ncbi:MAG: carboxypeptidase-like regulatory domain-containing protein, partial [Allomuricauda sp.]
MRRFLVPIFLLSFYSLFSQTKVSGIVVDADGSPIAFANIVFPNSTEGTITNDNGRFYLESDNTYPSVEVSFIGYESMVIELAQRVNYDMEVVLEESTEQSKEVIVYTGKQSKKNNP